ncbi:hypothetical protein [Actinophytocola sp.]|uniref:hypothetical protein n=1 Tax=Actinophytocola sp. TaxID=1872138 RepID=UPI002ED2AABF
MPKKTGIVVAAAVGLSVLALPAMADASQADERDLPGMVDPGLNPAVGEICRVVIVNC